jgi:hypothetical protein
MRGDIHDDNQSASRLQVVQADEKLSAEKDLHGSA